MHTREQDKKSERIQLHWDMIYNTIRLQSMDQSWTERDGLHNEVDLKMSSE